MLSLLENRSTFSHIRMRVYVSFCIQVKSFLLVLQQLGFQTDNFLVSLAVVFELFLWNDVSWWLYSASRLIEILKKKTTFS